MGQVAAVFCAWCSAPSDRGMIQKCRECSGWVCEHCGNTTRYGPGHVSPLLCARCLDSSRAAEALEFLNHCESNRTGGRSE